MSRDDVAKAVLGQLPAALAETVSLATPLTMSRIEGRDEAAAVLRELAESLGDRRAGVHRRRRRAGLRHIRRHWSRARGWSVRRPHQGLGGHLFGGRPLRPALAVREAGPRPSGRL